MHSDSLLSEGVCSAIFREGIFRYSLLKEVCLVTTLGEVVCSDLGLSEGVCSSGGQVTFKSS